MYKEKVCACVGVFTWIHIVMVSREGNWGEFEILVSVLTVILLPLSKSFNLSALLIPPVENADGAPFFTCCCLTQIRAELE